MGNASITNTQDSVRLSANANANAKMSIAPGVTTEPPAIEHYHPAPDTLVLTGGRCVGRRTDSDHCDRRWKPFVYVAYQCTNRAALTEDGTVSDLCTTCQRHEAASAPAKSHPDWNGRVNGPLPTDSKIAGSVWFTSKAVWLGSERPRTRRMEERAPRRRLIADLEILRFLRGSVPLNIERLSADNQITGQQLRDAVCMLSGHPAGADYINRYPTRARLCALIRDLMNPEVSPKPPFTVHYPKSESESD